LKNSDARLVLFAIVFLIPLRILYTNALTNPKSNIAVGMFMLVLFNIPTAIASIAFLSLLPLVLLHRVTWPLLSQLTYILTCNEVLEKRGLVRTIAVGLMVYGLSGIPGMSFILRTIELFNK
jgi:hypothetical protein